MSPWLTHWGLSADPFAGRNGGFVAAPVHAEALARIAYLVESGESRVSLRAAEGLGKTAILDRLAEEWRGPSARVVRVSADRGLLDSLAAALGPQATPRKSRDASAWAILVDAARVLRFQKKALRVLVDDAHLLPESGRSTLTRLSHLDTHPEAKVCVIDAGRDEPVEPWSLAIRLRPLSRSEAGNYLSAKLARAGRSEPVFTDRALTRLHALSCGVPRGLDRLAALAMMAGAAHGREVVSPEIIDGVAGEIVGPAAA